MSKAKLRKLCYSAVESGCCLNQYHLTGKGATQSQIVKLTGLEKAEVYRAISWLLNKGVILQANKGMLVNEVPAGFCWEHGLKYVDPFNNCSKCLLGEK